MAEKSTNTQPNDSYDLELYKNLRQEAAAYLEKVPALWLQKFVFAGAVLTFVVTAPADLSTLGRPSRELVIAGFICVPLLALLLDVKIFEYSLHARAISRFIQNQFRGVPRVVAWENALWGGGSQPEVSRLTRYRSAATVAVTLVSTAVLIVLSGVIVSSLAYNSFVALLIAALVAIAYVGAGLWAAFLIWPRISMHASKQRMD